MDSYYDMESEFFDGLAIIQSYEFIFIHFHSFFEIKTPDWHEYARRIMPFANRESSTQELYLMTLIRSNQLIFIFKGCQT